MTKIRFMFLRVKRRHQADDLTAFSGDKKYENLDFLADFIYVYD